MMRRIALLAAATAITAATVAPPPAMASAPLRVHAQALGKFIGYAAATGPLANEASYRTIAAREFNQVTPENALKWDATEPSDGSYSFGGADQVVAFAQANNQIVHGHTLVWHSQTPGWVQGLDATAMRAAMQDHIATVVGRYAANPAVQSWDVVNEVFDDNGALRNSFWLQRLGPGYIADAFRMARAADPDATLCINDYNVEGINAKSTAMYNLVVQLLGDGVPVNCVGFQGHLAVQFGFPGQVQQNMQRFADLGLEVRVTELDVRMILPRTPALDTQQATYYRNVVQACLAVDACAGITLWGFTDRYSWVPDTFPGQGAALIYDENYQPKPAYTAIHDALAGPPAPDPTPPTAPAGLTASGVTSSGVTLSWTASTDNVGVTGYEVLRGGVVVGIPTGTTFVDSGLTPATAYRYEVRARDAAGNRSALSAPLTVTTGPGSPGGGSCRVAYTISPWGGGGGFTAGLTLTNTGTAALNGWTLTFTLPAGQRLTPPGWAATWAQNGQTVTATPLDWNRNLAPNQSTSIGFNGSHTGNTAEPAAFTVNGNTCAVV